MDWVAAQCNLNGIKTYISKHPSPIQIDKKTHTTFSLRWDQHSFIESSLLRVISIHLLRKDNICFYYFLQFKFCGNIKFSWFPIDRIQNIFSILLNFQVAINFSIFFLQNKINSKVKNLEIWLKTRNNLLIRTIEWYELRVSLCAYKVNLPSTVPLYATGFTVGVAIHVFNVGICILLIYFFLFSASLSLVLLHYTGSHSVKSISRSNQCSTFIQQAELLRQERCVIYISTYTYTHAHTRLQLWCGLRSSLTLWIALQPHIVSSTAHIYIHLYVLLVSFFRNVRCRFLSLVNASFICQYSFSFMKTHNVLSTKRLLWNAPLDEKIFKKKLYKWFNHIFSS